MVFITVLGKSSAESPARIEPVRRELHSQPAGSRIFQHPPGLRRQNLGFRQIARRGMLQQLFIRHAGPQEVAQPARQRVRRQRRSDAFGACRGSTRSGRRILQIDPEKELGSDQNTRDRIAHRILV